MSHVSDLMAKARNQVVNAAGTAATYYTAAGSSTSVTVVVDEPRTSGGIEFRRVRLRASDVAAPAENDYLTLTGETLRRWVTEVRTLPSGDFSLETQNTLERQ